jgi:hypothetical protein
MSIFGSKTAIGLMPETRIGGFFEPLTQARDLVDAEIRLEI